ncbi:MAG: FAD-dependent oxidoreductase [Bacteroidota bacterium]|nr:FAD-dependent oxidoreductase [Bacteroidota bacterium]
MAKYVIVGGVAGGATTAARLRRDDEDAEIILFEKGPYISYANCGLPYYLGGVIKERDRLLVQTPESFGTRFNIDVRTMSEVADIDPTHKLVTVTDRNSGKIYTEVYDKLVLSPGAKAVIPNLPGANDSRVFTLRNVEDTDRIKAYIDTQNPKHAIVAGAGFIGLEMAENLHRKGLKVSVIEAGEQVLAPLDYEMAALIHQQFKTKEVALFLKSRLEGIYHEGENLSVRLSGNRTLNADLVIMSLGVKPDTSLAVKAGLELGITGGIVVDEYLQTSIPDIYAVGDSIEFKHPVTGKPGLSLLAGPANKQGRILADNMVFGHKSTYKGSIGSAIAKVFDLAAGSTGLSEKELIRNGIPCKSTIIQAGSHAGYYPGAMPMFIKITFSPDQGKLYGCQIVGYKGVDKRLDMAAAVIRSSGTVFDLQELEHAYAPPYSSAKDPINQIGFNAGNILNDLFKPLGWKEMRDYDPDEAFLLDVRTPEEFNVDTIPGSYNIEVDQIRKRFDEIPQDKKIYIFCGIGLRGYVASRILKQKGFDVYNLSGGLALYKQVTAPQSNEITLKNNSEINSEDSVLPKIDVKMMEVDACGLQCPGPIMKLKESIDKIAVGECVRQTATDQGFFRDVRSWCNVTGNKLISVDNKEGLITAVIEKTAGKRCDQKNVPEGDNKTIVVFSDDLDRALASFVIANGAASMGKKVTLFFTFWGLNVIKRIEKPKVKKDLMGRMFGMMMASSSLKLKLSKMNMANIGRGMMRKRMTDKNVDALEIMIQKAVDSGVNLIACQMSMDIMGVKQEELIDGVVIGGVANYLEEAEQANVNLFI